MISSLFLAVIINLAPILNIHLETPEGRNLFAQKLLVQAQSLQQKWNEVQQLQGQLQEKLNRLQQTARDTEAWRTLSAECETLSNRWQEKTAEFMVFRHFVDVANLGIREPDKIISLLQKYQADEELSEEETNILQTVARICEN